MTQKISRRRAVALGATALAPLAIAVAPALANGPSDNEELCFDKGALTYYPCEVPAPPPSFTGFHLGAAIGYGWGGAKVSGKWWHGFADDIYKRTRETAYDAWSAYNFMNGIDAEAVADEMSWEQNQHSAQFGEDIDLSGVLADLSLGYTEDFGDFVAGLEGSVGFSDYSGSGSTTLYTPSELTEQWWRQGFQNTTRSATLDIQGNWTAALLARVGYNPWDETLIYMTGGVEFHDVDASITNDRGDKVASTSKTLPGLTIGGGVEQLIDENLFVRAEYRYTNYDSFSMSGEDYYIEDGAALMAEGTKQWGHANRNTYSADVDMDMHAVRLMLGYRF